MRAFRKLRRLLLCGSLLMASEAALSQKDALSAGHMDPPKSRAPSPGDAKSPDDSNLFRYIQSAVGQCISTPEFIDKDYFARRRQGLFAKAGLAARQKLPLRRRYRDLARQRRNTEVNLEMANIETRLQELDSEVKHWKDKTINGYQIYFKDPWERKTGRRLQASIPGFKIRGGQPLLNYDIMMIDALARTLLNEAGICERAAKSRMTLGPEFCRQKCGTHRNCFDRCAFEEKSVGEAQIGLHYGMIISSIFDRKLIIETNSSANIREAFGRPHLQELRTAYWEQALSSTLQYSLWNTPNYPTVGQINPTLYTAACPVLYRNNELSKYRGDEETEYQWNLALRIAFDHYKLTTPEALALRQCRSTRGLEDSSSCLQHLTQRGHTFFSRGPYQPWLDFRGSPAGPLLFYTHTRSFPPPMQETRDVLLGSNAVRPLRLLYRTYDRYGRTLIREGASCKPRLWKNPILEPHLKSHPL